MPKIYEMIAEGLFDPTQIITHSLPLEEAAQAYEIFDKKKDKNNKSCFETLKSVKNTGDFLYAQNQTKYP